MGDQERYSKGGQEHFEEVAKGSSGDISIYVVVFQMRLLWLVSFIKECFISTYRCTLLVLLTFKKNYSAGYYCQKHGEGFNFFL